MRVYRVPGVPDGVGQFRELSFGADSRRLAVMDGRPSVRWLDLDGGEITRTLSIPYAWSVALSPDHSLLGAGRYVMNQAGRESTLIERYELPNPNPAFVWELPRFFPRAAACVPDGSGFAVAVENHEPYPQQFPFMLCGWDGRRGDTIGPVPLSWWPPEALAFSPDGRRLACAGKGGEVMMLDWPGGERVGEFSAPVTQRIRFAPHRPHLAVVAKKSVVVLDASEVRRRSEPGSVSRVAILQRGHRDRVTDVAFSPSGEQLLTVSADATARVWSLARKRCVKCFEWGVGGLTAAAWSADGTLCAAAGTGGQIVVWDADE